MLEEQHTHYTFEYRREWARLRRAGFYAADSEKLCKELLHDQLNFYGSMYIID
jgi:hypothetical protein